MPKTVVITGASAGVGRAVVRRFAADGWRIGLIARGRAGLEAAAGDVEAAGAKARICPADVADADAIERSAGAIERSLGPIDVWINCAMATVFSPFSKISAEEFRRSTEVTYLGVVHGTMSALRRMAPRDSGVILQVGSALAYRSIPLQAPYCGAKHAVVGFTDALRSELIHDGSRVQLVIVHLPAMNTPQFDWARNKLPRRPEPLPPIYQPEIAADAIHFAAHHRRRELWLGWPTVEAIVGQRTIPGYLDRLLAETAYSGQQAEQKARERPDNLFKPVEGDFGAHGRFDACAREHSSELWLAKHWPRFLSERLFNRPENRSAANSNKDSGAGRRKPPT